MNKKRVPRVHTHFFSVNNSITTLSRLNLFLRGYNFFGRLMVTVPACTLFVNDLHMAPVVLHPPHQNAVWVIKTPTFCECHCTNTLGRVFWLAAVPSPTGNRTPEPRHLDGILRWNTNIGGNNNPNDAIFARNNVVRVHAGNILCQ